MGKFSERVGDQGQGQGQEQEQMIWASVTLLMGLEQREQTSLELGRYLQQSPFLSLSDPRWTQRSHAAVLDRQLTLLC